MNSEPELEKLWMEQANKIADKEFPKGQSEDRGVFLLANALLYKEIVPIIQTHYIARKDVQAAIPGNPITPNVDRYNEGWYDALAIVKSNLGIK